MRSKALVQIINAQISHSLAAPPVVTCLSLQINPGDAWVITGPLGAGKTTILEAIRGDKSVSKDSIQYPLLEKKIWPSEVFKILRSQVSVAGNAAYYSERYHSRREEDAVSLQQWLSSDLPQSSTTERGTSAVQQVAHQLDLQDYLSSSTMNLSNGQSKRANIAKALLAKPQVLLLDEPFVGLDTGARRNLVKVLGNLISTGTTEIILALRPLDDIPDWATHMLWLNQDGTTQHAGPLTSSIISHFKTQIASTHDGPKQISEQESAIEGDVLVQLQAINVAYWGKQVLQNISWTIKEGQKWALKGSNGSGKTTLLAMILGDHPKIFANQVHLFGRRRGIGDGRSVFEIQAQIGHSSPELHRHYPRYRLARECIASAYGDTFHPPRNLTAAQEAQIEAIIEYFGIHDYQDVKMSDLSPALQRLMLLLRALVKKPKLVILDEPFAGMDGHMIATAKKYIDEKIEPHQAVIFVTHYDDEIPCTVTRTITLDRGRVVT